MFIYKIYLTLGVIPEDFSAIHNFKPRRWWFRSLPRPSVVWYKDKMKTEGFQRNQVHAYFNAPIKRYKSVNCLLWHKPCNRCTRVCDHLYNVCTECKCEARCALQNAKRSVLVEDSLKMLGETLHLSILLPSCPLKVTQ